MIRDATPGVQSLIGVEHVADRAQRLDRERREAGDREPTRRRVRHPAWDIEINAVVSADRYRDVGVARDANHLELRTCEGMEWVVDCDFRRLGIVRC